jgi:hypothetical protein
MHAIGRVDVALAHNVTMSSNPKRRDFFASTLHKAGPIAFPSPDSSETLQISLLCSAECWFEQRVSHLVGFCFFFAPPATEEEEEK